MKRARDQSQEKPRRRICSKMRPPYSSYQAPTRAWKRSRPSSSLVVPSAASWRSMTFWVAIAAWSVPGHHSTSYPSMRRWRARMSCTDCWSACPAWSAPVMFGGGRAIENDGRLLLTSAMPTPSSSQRARQRGSTSDGEKDLSMGAPGRARSIEGDARGQT